MDKTDGIKMKKTLKSGKTVFVCEECGFAYKEKAIAQKCENWCRKHHSCNIEITRFAIQ